MIIVCWYFIASCIILLLALMINHDRNTINIPTFIYLFIVACSNSACVLDYMVYLGFY